MRQFFGWKMVGVLASIGIVAVTTTAAVDHVNKTHAIARASVFDWYCTHQGTACDERKPDAIEDSWNRRERFYKLADVGLFVVAAAAVIAVRRRRLREVSTNSHLWSSDSAIGASHTPGREARGDD